MNQTFDEAPMPVRLRRGRVARIALVFTLAAVGVGLLAWTAHSDAPPDGNLPTIQVAPQSQSLEEILAQGDMIPTHRHPLLGRPAPDFELADSTGKVRNLKELSQGGPVVLIFYYGAHCLACVRHLSEVNRDLPLFREIGARVIAISADPPELTRQQFGQAPFGFQVLSDPENTVARAYGVFRQTRDGGANEFRHGTMIVDRDGLIQWVNIGDAPFRRNSALLCQLAKLDGR